MAYASVASLMRTMGVVLASKLPMRSVISDHEEEFLALHKKVSFFEIFLKNFEKNKTSGKMTDLEAQIKELATVVEQIIQQRITEIVTADNVLQREKIHEWFQDSLKQVVEEFDCVQKELTKFQDKGKQAPKEFLVQDSSSVKHTPYVENNMVGRDDQMKWMLTELTRYGGSSGELKVIPIVGMGGVGKTTLAKEVYNDESIRLHFDVRAWATVSQKHNIKEILLSLWRCEKGENIYVDSEAELADKLQKSLKGKRYLIVLDDMWDSEAWDAVRLCFPSENNGSRILLTTRNTEVARCAGTKNLSLQMSFMDQHESWKLFESIAFSNEVLPSEFETIGKQIVNKCHGLPLSISVVAGLLKSRRTIEYWENVAKDVKSVTNDPDKQFLDVLGLSYNQLTSDLKACLLYFGIFPEDKEISAKSLARFWMAEGFLKLENNLEGEAEKCLHELVDRCLVLVCKKSSDGTKIRSCKVHDLIHDLCLREIQRGNVFIMDDIGFKVSRAQHSMHKMHPFEKSDANHVPSESLLSPMHMMQPFKKLDGKHFPSGSLISPMQMMHPFEKLDGKHFPSGSLISPMQMMQPFKKLDRNHFLSGSLISLMKMVQPFKKLDGKHFPSGSLSSPMHMMQPFEKLEFPSDFIISFSPSMEPFKKLEEKHFPSVSLISPLQMTHPFKSSISNAFAMYSSPRDLYRALLTPVHRQLRFHDDNNFVERTHSIFLFGRYSTAFNLSNFHYKLLKVLDLRCMHIYSFPEQIVNLIWLTYLALSFVREFHIPRAIYRLWNLQTFIAEGSNFAIGYFHEEIWGLMQLRHLELRRFYLPNLPDGSVNKGRLLDFPNIQTISYLSPRYCTKEVILGIQNAKKLGIGGDVDDFKSIQDSGLLNNLVHLQQLETLSLKLIFCPMSVRISLGTIPSAKAFPATLKKLKLDGTWLSWSCLDIIAELPNLEVLKLMNAACCGEEWHPNVRGFTRLKLLHIIQHDLKYWEATHDNFPVLERLMLSGFRYLKEIPIEFAEINTLQQIVLRGCLPELGESAARIQKEQDDLGNKPVDVHFSD
ncbi:hypothetical protein P3S68_008960 [Capsicum galapagoense]